MPQGMPGFEMPQYQPMSYQPQMPAPEPRRGMFGGKAAGIASAIAEAVATFAAGMGAPQGLQSINARKTRQQELEDQQAQAAMAEQGREAKYQDWVRQQQWQLEHPQAANNDSANDWRFYQQNLSPEEFDQWKRNNVVDRPVIVQGPNGPIAVRPSELGGGAANRPAIGATMPDPRKQGGAGPSGPLTFR